MSLLPRMKGVSPEKQASRWAKYISWMRTVRPNEVINGGAVVMGRHPEHSRVKPNSRVFEHGTVAAATAEAIRLSQIYSGENFEVWVCVGSATGGELSARESLIREMNG